ncbi:MAG: DUF5703 domain-containing protein [Prolixibacteraceae bacterium]
MKQILFPFLFILLIACQQRPSDHYTVKYNPVWTTPSANSSESMPCGGHDIGLNVWLEKGDLLFYMQQSGAFDENNTFLKAGRIRLTLAPNPFTTEEFKQELQLENGSVVVSGISGTKVTLWVDVFKPVVHVEIESEIPVDVVATYESWRFADRELAKNESFQNSYKWAPPAGLFMKKDSIAWIGNQLWFYHQNKGETVFDAAVQQQGLKEVKEELFNPLDQLFSGGCMLGKNFSQGELNSGSYQNTDFKGWQICSEKPTNKYEILVILENGKFENIDKWKRQVEKTLHDISKEDQAATVQWWHDYWNRSFIQIDVAAEDSSKAEEVARNYQLFRYMMGCNAYGSYPTKFNGGLFTVDPVFTNEKRAFTPDFRNWGGGTFTAQNQRLVYFPLFKSGDTDMLKPQLDFYLNLLKTAELRSHFYWGHKGACFTEQVENFGLPNPSEYGWKRPDDYDKGMQYNKWLEYQWDTSLEFCYMALLWHKYTGQDISEYLPMIESCLTFFDEHYQFLARQRGDEFIGADGKLLLYPGSSCETYKMATNATSTISALRVVTEELLRLPDGMLNSEAKAHWTSFQQRIPELAFRSIDGETTIAPAKMWERINNTEVPQLYPVFPWGIYGVGKPNLEIAINTWKFDPDAQKFRSAVGWKQDAIWAARMGLVDEASTFIQQKLGNSENRFPAFWGPGFDWTPDHNWGGSGMIALQEMLLQTNGDSILLFPAWPKEWNVHFKLHAPGNTTVEAELRNGEVVTLDVVPAERKKDLVILINEPQ